MRAPRLHLAVTPHGYGHLTLLAAILRPLRSRLPRLRLTIETTLPRAAVAAHVDEPFALTAAGEDFGLVMRSPVAADLAGSAERYRRLHRNWPQAVREAADRLRAVDPDLVVSSAGYIAPAAARAAGVPSIVVSPINWLQVFRRYLADSPDAARITAEMAEAYASAAIVLVPEGGLPETDLPNAVPVGPVGTVGRARRAELRTRLRLGDDERLGIITFGGVDAAPLLERWPTGAGWRWVTRQDVDAGHPDAVHLRALPDMPFVDLVASADAVVTKLGYGTCVECAFVGAPTLYQPREDDWFEEPRLRAWLAQHAPLAPVDRATLENGAHVPLLDAIVKSPRPGPPAAPTGVDACLRQILARL